MRSLESQDRDFEASIPVRLRYRLYVPDDVGTGRMVHPLIVYLHGAAARGSNLAAVASNGLPASIEGGVPLPFVVAAPQCPKNLDWSMILPALDRFVEHVLETAPVDPDRVYLTGLSMGGFGVWALASEYPDRFAAAAPICGGGRPLLDFPDRLRRLGRLPVWAFHGSDDREIPVGETLRLVDALERLGGDVRCTVYPGVGHDAWTQTYADPDLYKWFLGQSRDSARRTSAMNSTPSFP